jgi:hypothetical protein
MYDNAVSIAEDILVLLSMVYVLKSIMSWTDMTPPCLPRVSVGIDGFRLQV